MFIDVAIGYPQKCRSSESVDRAAENVASAANGLGGENAKYSVAPTALSAYKAYKELQAVDNGVSPIASIGLSVGFNSQKSSQAASAFAPVVTELTSGGSTAIVAEQGNITGNGAQIAAGFDKTGKPVASNVPSVGNVLLSAGKDISLSSVQASSDVTSSSRSTGATIGVSVDIGKGGPSAGIKAEASHGSAKSNSAITNEINSRVTGTGTVALNSGEDTNLKGAVVLGNTVIANVGGDLSIESRQNTATYDEKTKNASIGLSISSAGVKVSGGAGTAKIEGDYANVSEQSGIVAGSGGYNVTAEGGVDLKGGVIASSAAKNNNSLTADHLTYSDIENLSEASSSGKGITLSPSGLPLPSVNQPAAEEDKGVAKATLTPGTLTLTNQAQDLASLNTDLSKANTQVDPFDIDELKAKQRSTAALSELLNMGVGDLSEKLGFDEGSPVKVALHAAVGAAVAAAAGGNIGQGALAGALSEIANAALQEVLKADPNLTDEQKSAITQWVAVAVGAAVGGQGGAAAALDNVNYNYLTHAERKEFEKVLAACGMGDASSCNRVDELRDLSAARDQKLDDCVGQASSSCVSARTDLRVAAATYLDAALSGGGDDLDELSLLERHMVFLSVWKYADSKDDTSGQNLSNVAATLKSEQARALLTGTKEEIAKIVRDPIMLGVILYGGHGNAKAIVGGTGSGNGGASTTPRDVPDILSMFPKRSDWPQLSGSLRTAADSAAAALKGEGKINFGMGSFSREQTMVMGEAWVGSGYRITSKGFMESEDGLRQFRPPSYKPKLDIFHANFEQRLTNKSEWGANGHVEILQ